jgi:hypothetical protein
MTENPKTRLSRGAPPTKFWDLMCGYGVCVIAIAIWADRNGVLLDSLIPAAVAAISAVFLAFFQFFWRDGALAAVEEGKMSKVLYYVTLSFTCLASAGAGILVWTKLFS